MSPTPQVQPLSRNNRRLVFILLLSIFVVAVPMFVFYANGYRYDVFGENPSITATGGIYISANSADTEMFIDENPVKNLRMFRNAAYVQGLTPGVHRIHVQGEGLETWVKELPVYPHIVTEVAAFNLPLVPQIRPITPQQIRNGDQVFLGTSTYPFGFASSSANVIATSTNSTIELLENPEYEYIESLFSTSTATTTIGTRGFISRVANTFQFSSDVGTSSTATTTVSNSEIMLREYQDGVYAVWTGDSTSIPYYFCVPFLSEATTTALYGEHVSDSLAAVIEAYTESELLRNTEVTNRICREKIRIDDTGKKVLWFSFLPDSIDHVLVMYEDGLYVTELDDRSWQNSQLLYPGENLFVVVDSGQIFVNDNGHFAEVFTELQE